MALLTKSYLTAKAEKASPYLSEAYIRSFSAERLALNAKSASLYETFDIFLSHSREDAILIKGLRDELVELGFSVYVDWIEDPQLDRSNVTKATAEALRTRMKQSKSLLFATSEASKKSVWMPWELGFMDAFTTSRVAIVPMVEDYDAYGGFEGQEYLGVYPYLDKTLSTLWLHKSPSQWVRFKDWLAGSNP
jgi:hypothetical protein